MKADKKKSRIQYFRPLVKPIVEKSRRGSTLPKRGDGSYRDTHLLLETLLKTVDLFSEPPK